MRHCATRRGRAVGEHFAVCASDLKVRLFSFRTIIFIIIIYSYYY